MVAPCPAWSTDKFSIPRESNGGIASLKGDFALQPTLTYIPNPGQSPDLAPATAITVRLTSLF